MEGKTLQQSYSMFLCHLQVDCSAARKHHKRLSACVKQIAEENAGDEVLLLAIDALSKAVQSLRQVALEYHECLHLARGYWSFSGIINVLLPVSLSGCVTQDIAAEELSRPSKAKGDQEACRSAVSLARIYRRLPRLLLPCACLWMHGSAQIQA
jgi:hypothetical protein